MAIARFPSIVIDCPDPAALAAFYGTMLDWNVEPHEGWFEVRASGGAPADSPRRDLSLPELTYASSGMTVAASRSICSGWSNSGVNRISSAPASTTWRSSRTQSAAVPVIAAASKASDRNP